MKQCICHKKVWVFKIIIKEGAFKEVIEDLEGKSETKPIEPKKSRWQERLEKMQEEHDKKNDIKAALSSDPIVGKTFDDQGLL